MAVPVYNVEAAEGGTVTIRVQVQESDGSAADLDGFVGSMQVRADPLSEDVLATGTVTVGDDGLVTAVVAADDTIDWTVGHYDIRLEDGEGLVEYVVRGKITLHPTVTAG